MILNSTITSFDYDCIALTREEFYCFISLSLTWIIFSSVIIVYFFDKTYRRHEFLMRSHAALVKQFIRDNLFSPNPEMRTIARSGAVYYDSISTSL